jgi:hypothetical protein
VQPIIYVTAAVYYLLGEFEGRLADSLLMLTLECVISEIPSRISKLPLPWEPRALASDFFDTSANF